MTATVKLLDKEELRQIVAGVIDIDTSELHDHTHFVDDLEVDSLMGLEVLVVLEKRYQVRLVESELNAISTLDGAYALLSDRLAR